MQRNLDGVYFRIRRGDTWETICWTDLTPEERNLVSNDRPIEWWKGLTEILTDVLINIGNQLDLYASYPTTSSAEIVATGDSEAVEEGSHE